VSTIIDPDLTLRLGALAPDEAARIEDYATAAFLWRGLRQDEALDVARALHWCSVGRDPAADPDDVVTALAMGPLPPGERERLAARLAAECPVVRPTEPTGRRPTLAELRSLGERLSRALVLLGPVAV
jgi:hypothetical protein